MFASNLKYKDLVAENARLRAEITRLQQVAVSVEKSLAESNTKLLNARDDNSRLKIQIEEKVIALAIAALNTTPVSIARDAFRTSSAHTAFESSSCTPITLSSAEPHSSRLTLSSAEPHSSRLASSAFKSHPVLSHQSTIGVLVAPGKNYFFKCSKCERDVVLSWSMLAKWLDPEGRVKVNEHGVMKLPGKCDGCKAAATARSGGGR